MGVVETAETEIPIPFALVSLDEDREIFQADSTGQFCISEIYPGYHYVTAVLDGYYPSRRVYFLVEEDSCDWVVIPMQEAEKEYYVIACGLWTLQILAYWKTQEFRRLTSEDLKVLPASDVYDILRKRGGVTVR